MPNVDVVVTISDENIERICDGFLRVWAMPQEGGGDKYPQVRLWISVKMEDYLLEIANRGLVLLAQESVEEITSL